MDLRHPDPRIGRGDHDLRGPMSGPGPIPPGMNMPPAVRPQQSPPDMDP